LLQVRGAWWCLSVLLFWCLLFVFAPHVVLRTNPSNSDGFTSRNHALCATSMSCIRVCMFASMCVRLFVCMYACMYVCMYMCMCVCI
jgi:ABC-type sulfate transport system permease component